MDNDKYIGRLLDNRYEIQEVIGVGGMAVVYKARCHRLNRLVAIKILKDEYSQDEEFRRRFHAEGQAVAMLSHPNIVSVYDVSTSNEADYIVMELIDGISLKQYMEKKGILNWKETLHFGIQISKALEHAHSRGIVHRDIKPHNVMVLKNGSVKVADFGIARVMSKSNTLTKEALGSVHYISPEQAKGGRVDNRSDIYSLGIVMYEMMTGRPPYDGESPVAVAIQHINGGAKMPSTINPNIPGGLEQIIMKAMAHEPSARYATATAMLYDMDEFRKLPTILFDYNTPPTEEVTRLQPKPELPVQNPKVTTAEKVAGSTAGTDTPRRRPQRRTDPKAASNASKPQKAQPARRRREYEEGESSKAATIAVIACSAVAIIAIIIFLITLFNGGILGNKPQLVVVPQLLGKNYDTLQVNGDVVLGEPKYDYSSTYEKGRVSEQNPKPGDKVEKGTEVSITVSLGPAPQVKVMSNLTGQKRETAENFLNGQDVLFLCEEAYSNTIDEGRVIRTEPAAGENLPDGQTVILYISIGPEIKKGNMPDVVGQTLETARMVLDMQDLGLVIEEEKEQNEEVPEGNIIRTEPEANADLKTGDVVILYISEGPEKAKMINVLGEDIKTALKMLEVAGFTTVKYDEYVENDAPKGQVVEQSAQANEEIPINTEIVLKLSMGPLVTKSHIFTLPEDRVDAYKLTITSEDGTVVFGPQDVFPPEEGMPSIELVVTGRDVVAYDILINGEKYSTQRVNFNEVSGNE